MTTLSDYKPTDLSSITQELENQGAMPSTNVTDTGITSVLTGGLAPTAAQLGGLEKYTLPQSLAIAGEAGLSGIKEGWTLTGKVPKELSTETQRLINTLQGYKRSPNEISRFKLEDVLDPEILGGSIIGKESYGSPTKEQIEKTWEQVGINPDDMIPGTYDPETGIPYQAGLLSVSAIKAMLAKYGKNRLRYGLASTGANILLEAKAKAAEKKAAADARKKQRMSDKQYDDWRRHNDAGYNKTADEKLAMTGGTEEWGEDMMGGTEAPGNGNVSAETGTDFGPNSAMIARGGLAQHAPRYANGGLIDFFRYGGFIG